MLVVLASASVVRMEHLLRVYSVEILLMMDGGLVRNMYRVLYQINLRNSTYRWFLL